MTGYQALPQPGQDHDCEIREYFRVCPAGHLRRGHVCGACAGNGAIICNECPGEAPAILIPLGIWVRIMAREWELITSGLLRRGPARPAKTNVTGLRGRHPC